MDLLPSGVWILHLEDLLVLDTIATFVESHMDIIHLSCTIKKFTAEKLRVSSAIKCWIEFLIWKCIWVLCMA
jgi:hypothetical protein